MKKGFYLYLYRWVFLPSLIIFFILNSGCVILNPPKKDKLGYYESHYTACGPIAVAQAIRHYCVMNGIKLKKDITPIDVSREIQDRGSRLGILSIFNTKAVEITWPHEIIEVCKHYGFEAKLVKDISEIDMSIDTAIILVHKKHTLVDYHWVCHPARSITAYGRDNTVIDDVYILVPAS
jgi:hypothetical protein